MAQKKSDDFMIFRNNASGRNTKLTEVVAAEACRLYFDKKKTQQDIGALLGVSATTVGNCCRLARLLANEEYEVIYKMISENSIRYEIVCSIAEFVGKPFPPPSKPMFFDDKDHEEPEHAKNEGTYLVKVLESLESLIKQNERILDAISFLASDIKDNKNANSDMIATELRSIKTSVETIKNNTRRKGA